MWKHSKACTQVDSTHIHMRSHTCTHTHSPLTPTHTHSHTHSPLTLPHTHTHIHTRHSHSHTHTLTYTLATHTPTLTRVHIYTRHSHSHTHTCTHIHSHSHTHTLTYTLATHTPTHTHTRHSHTLTGYNDGLVNSCRQSCSCTRSHGYQCTLPTQRTIDNICNVRRTSRHHYTLSVSLLSQTSTLRTKNKIFIVLVLLGKSININFFKTTASSVCIYACISAPPAILSLILLRCL